MKDPLDEASRTRFFCSLDNKAVLKALFKFKDDELTFHKAYQVTQEIKEAAKAAKETVYWTTSKSVYKVGQQKRKANPPRAPIPKAKDTSQRKPTNHLPRFLVKTHTGKDCPI